MNIVLDRHIPRSTVNVTVISSYPYGWRCLRQQLGLHLMHNDQMLGIIKLRVVSQQLPAVPTLFRLFNQTHVLHTHVWWLSLALLGHGPCHPSSLGQEDAANKD